MTGEPRQAHSADGVKANRLSDEEKRVIIDKVDNCVCISLIIYLFELN